MDSIVNQTLEDIEIVCINDGSKDSSLSILQSYAEKDDRIIIIDKENGGYGMGMNIGIARATGEYIGIVEPDDYVSLEMFGDLYEIASKNDLDFVKADFYRFVSNKDGSEKRTYFALTPDESDYNIIFDPSTTPKAIKYVMNTWSGIYKRSFLNEHNILHNETPGASFQDNGFWIQTFIFGKRAMIINKPYYMNRRDNPNSSVYDRKKIYTMNVEYDHIRDIFMEHPDLWERFKGMYWYKKYYSYLASVGRIAKQIRPEYIKRMSAEFRRGSLRGEIDYKAFSSGTKENIDLLIDHPDIFYANYRSGDRLRKARNNLKKIRVYGLIKKAAKLPGKIKNKLSSLRSDK
jgi:glycosyltransferase involved in cell wall biosynthesis